MKILFDLHTHSTYSGAPVGTHGKGSVAENAAAAAAKGMGVAISDHGPGHYLYGVKPEAYTALKRGVQAAGAHVLCGVESNVTNAAGDTDLPLLPFAPDVVLMGYHKGVKGSVSFMARALLTPKAMRLRMTAAIIAALEKYPIDVLTHPGEYVPIDMVSVAKAAAALGVALEINERRHISLEDARIAMEHGARFVLSSDAHTPEAVCRLERAKSFCETARIPENLIANSSAYDFASGLRLDRLALFAGRFRQ